MIHHELNCPKPGTELATGTKGDTMERCTHCHAWAPIGRPRPRPRPPTVEPMPNRQRTVPAALIGQPFTHAEDCSDPDDAKLDAVVGRLGDPLLRCPACRKFKVVRPESVTPELDEAVAPEAPTSRTSRYVCRDHGRPVSWRGSGCPDCARELRRRKRPKRPAPDVDQLVTW